MPKQPKTEIETMWFEKPRPDDKMPSHVVSRVIFEVSTPTVLKGEATRFKFKIHGVLSDKAKPAYVVYPKTMSIGNSPVPLFEPDEVFGKVLDAHARAGMKAILDQEGDMHIGIRYKVKQGGKVVRESRPGV